MKKQNVRVVVASERPDVRGFLKEMVEYEGGVTVGQAEDAQRTLTLVRSQKPDVAIIDCYLPYVYSPHFLRLSRVGGLDTAQAIAQQTPDTRVVLLNNLDSVIAPGRASPPESGMAYSIKAVDDDLPLAIRKLLEAPESLVFANVEAKPQEPAIQKGTSPADVAVFFGACGIAAGWFLIVSMISFNVGGILGLSGVAAVVLGMAAKLSVSVRRRLMRRKP